MKFLNRVSFFKKNVLLSSINILLIGSILIWTAYVLQSKVLLDTLKTQTTNVTNKWSAELDVNDVLKAQQEASFDDEYQKKLTNYFDLLSEYNPNIAQGYIFGTELEDGNKTSIIADPSHIVAQLKEGQVPVGAMIEQPAQIAKNIEKMLHTREVTFTDVYDDTLGTWITVLYPLTNDQNDIFAYFAVDVDASMIPKGQTELLKWGLLALVLVASIILIIQYFITKKSFAPLNYLVKAIDDVAEGNLSIQLKESEDELGRVNKKFNQMVSGIKNLLLNVKDVSYNVNQASTELNSITEQNGENSIQLTADVKEMYEHIKTQEYSTLESSHAMNDIAISIQTIASNTTKVSDSATEMEAKSQEGNESIHDVINQMRQINRSVKDTEALIKSLENRSNEIGNIIGVITDIANQTNLLSLNAAIEAARAGEHGRGFAVVANEVRKLAEQSAKSAEQIVHLITEIQEATKLAVNSMHSGSNEVATGLTIAEKTGDIFENIVKNTMNVVAQIQEVSSATEQISATTEEVSATVKELTTIANKTSANATSIFNNIESQKISTLSIADSSNKLNGMSTELETQLTKFKL